MKREELKKTSYFSFIYLPCLTYLGNVLYTCHAINFIFIHSQTIRFLHRHQHHEHHHPHHPTTVMMMIMLFCLLLLVLNDYNSNRLYSIATWSLMRTQQINRKDRIHIDRFDCCNMRWKVKIWIKHIWVINMMMLLLLLLNCIVFGIGNYIFRQVLQL